MVAIKLCEWQDSLDCLLLRCDAEGEELLTTCFLWKQMAISPPSAVAFDSCKVGGTVVMLHCSTCVPVTTSHELPAVLNH